jgi:hypothetical protein
MNRLPAVAVDLTVVARLALVVVEDDVAALLVEALALVVLVVEAVDAFVVVAFLVVDLVVVDLVEDDAVARVACCAAASAVPSEEPPLALVRPAFFEQVGHAPAPWPGQHLLGHRDLLGLRRLGRGRGVRGAAVGPPGGGAELEAAGVARCPC